VARDGAVQVSKARPVKTRVAGREPEALCTVVVLPAAVVVFLPALAEPLG
jgi:hypothetical protein